MDKTIGMLATLGFSVGAIVLGSGCTNTTPTTQANGNGIHSDVTDVRPIEPVQAAYQPPIYDTTTNIPTAKQPVTGYAGANVTPVSDDTTVVSTTPTGKNFAGKSTHTVRKGETLFSIAKSTYGDGKAWKRIVSANPGVTPAKLKVGQVLVMPASS